MQNQLDLGECVQGLRPHKPMRVGNNSNQPCCCLLFASHCCPVISPVSTRAVYRKLPVFSSSVRRNSCVLSRPTYPATFRRRRLDQSSTSARCRHVFCSWIR